jgi:transcriptional regulator with XRE-family HTH domain
MIAVPERKNNHVDLLDSPPTLTPLRGESHHAYADLAAGFSRSAGNLHERRSGTSEDAVAGYTISDVRERNATFARRSTVVDRRFRSRRAELAAFRAECLAKGATVRHLAMAIASRFNVNSRIAYRYAHGLTQQQVADRWNEHWPSTAGKTLLTHKNISYWEAWPAATGRRPSLETLNRLARIYRCAASDLIDGEDYTEAHQSAAGAPRASASISRPSPVEVQAEPSDVVTRVDSLIAASGATLLGQEVNYERLVQSLIEWAYRMKRRDILQWLSWAAASASAAPVLNNLDPTEQERTLGAFVNPSRVDSTVIDHIDGVLWRCMRQDDMLGPQAALDTVLAQRRLVQSILPSTPSPLNRRLLSLYANLSRFAGWLSFDLNNHKSAAEYYEAARAAAHEAHDTELGAFVLCNMSHLAAWQGHPRIGIDHAIAAIGWANQTDDHRLKAYAYDVAARAYAMDKQETAAMTAIDNARAALDTVAAGSAKTHTYFYSPGLLRSTEGVCHLHLGHAEQGARISEAALAEINVAFVRNLAMGSLRVGICHLRSAKPDVARGVAAIGDAARLSAHNRSARLSQRLNRAWNDLAQWRDAPEVRSLHEQMTAYGALTGD